ncbi:uncharacterized protein ACBT44_002492 [Syngnathus typhle]
MVALLAIAVRVIPQCSRVKDFFWPQIPKPRIIGIDPLILKKGNLEEINQHLSNFHSNIAPFFIDTNVWETVTPDSIYLTSSKDCTIPIETPNQVTDTFGAPHDLTPTAALHQHVSQPHRRSDQARTARLFLKTSRRPRGPISLACRKT